MIVYRTLFKLYAVGRKHRKGIMWVLWTIHLTVLALGLEYLWAHLSPEAAILGLVPICTVLYICSDSVLRIIRD